MLLKFLNECDFVNYKKPSMFVGFPICSFKCGSAICHNIELINEENIEIDATDVIRKYMDNPITEAVVFGGLEPFDSWEDVKQFIETFRMACEDEIVIYTGYRKDEIEDKIDFLKSHRNIIVKFGRYIPDQDFHYDELLGVNLASDNQYSERIS